MKRINEMFPLVVVLLTTMLTGCPMGSPPPTADGGVDPLEGTPCTAGEIQACDYPCWSAAVRVCPEETSRWTRCTPDEIHGHDTCAPAPCTGPATCSTPCGNGGLRACDTTTGLLGPCDPIAPGLETCDAGVMLMDGGMPPDDAGTTDTDSGTSSGTDGGTMPDVDAGPLMCGGCVDRSSVRVCETRCGFAGGQTCGECLSGLCCHPLAPSLETCPMADPVCVSGSSGTDAGMPPGTDAGTMPGTDSGSPGMDAGTPPMCGGCFVDDCAGDCGYLGLYLCVGGVRSDECTTYVASPFGGPTTTVGTGDECRPGREPIPCPGGLVLFNDSTGAYDDFCSQFTRTDICGTDAGVDAGPPPMMDAGTDAGPGTMTDAGAGVMDAGMSIDAGRDSGPPACVPSGSEVCGNAVDEDCSGSAALCPPGVTSSGYYLVLDSSVWCPTGGTVEARSWDNQNNDVPNTEEMHFGPSPLRVPIGSDGHALTWSYTNDTVFCRTGPGRYDGYYSPRLRGATNGATCNSLGARVFINGVEVSCFVCWDTTFAGTVPASTEYRRLQSRLTLDPTAHTSCMTGTL